MDNINIIQAEKMPGDNIINNCFLNWLKSKNAKSTLECSQCVTGDEWQWKLPDS